MTENNLLTTKNITIIGLGLIGGSIALALKGKCKSIDGVDVDRETIEKAKELNLFDNVYNNIKDITPETDIIILATPVEKIIEIISKPNDIPAQKAIILDVGSSKVEIVQAMKRLPNSFQPIGGHPISGKESLSIDNADAKLFIGSTFVLTALDRTTETTKQLANEIIDHLGATPLKMTPVEHDIALAATSHVPFLTASALALSVPLKGKQLISTGYRSAARLAATPSSMMLNVLLSNKENIIPALEKFRENLNHFIDLLIEEDSVNLEATLVKCASQHKKLISN